MVFAWLASDKDLAVAGIEHREDVGSRECYVLASPHEGQPSEASVDLQTDASGKLWIGGFEAPFGDRWREYVTALTLAAVSHARGLGCTAVWVDVYEYGDATREPLAEIGFVAQSEGDRSWTLALGADTT